MSKKTTQQVKKVPNPTGKGGFKDHPENQSPGGWDKNNTPSYWLNYFNSLPIDEFKGYKIKHPDMTMAALGSYARIAKQIDELADYKEVSNRIEGMPKQQLDMTSQGDKIEGVIIYRPKKDEDGEMDTISPAGKSSKE